MAGPGRYASTVRRGVVVLLGAVLTLLTLLLLAGHGPWAGSVIWALSSYHGLNMGDLPVLGAYVIGLGCCVWLWGAEQR